MPDDFDDRLLATLGTVVTERRFARVGRALVIYLSTAPPGGTNQQTTRFALQRARRS